MKLVLPKNLNSPNIKDKECVIVFERSNEYPPAVYEKNPTTQNGKILVESKKQAWSLLETKDQELLYDNIHSRFLPDENFFEERLLIDSRSKDANQIFHYDNIIYHVFREFITNKDPLKNKHPYRCKIFLLSKYNNRFRLFIKSDKKEILRCIVSDINHHELSNKIIKLSKEWLSFDFNTNSVIPYSYEEGKQILIFLENEKQERMPIHRCYISDLSNVTLISKEEEAKKSRHDIIIDIQTDIAYCNFKMEQCKYLLNRSVDYVAQETNPLFDAFKESINLTKAKIPLPQEKIEILKMHGVHIQTEPELTWNEAMLFYLYALKNRKSFLLLKIGECKSAENIIKEVIYNPKNNKQYSQHQEKLYKNETNSLIRQYEKSKKVMESNKEIEKIKETDDCFKKWLGESDIIHRLMKSTLKRSKDKELVLVSGESGTGKEFVAEAIHEIHYPETPFVMVNCKTFTETLAVSQLFGYEEGSHNSANETTGGFFQAADKGVLFLDEFHLLSLHVQGMLLRAVNDVDKMEVMKIGATKPDKINVKVVFATTKTKEELLNAEDHTTFLPDLINRLNPYSTIVVPPLRDRGWDRLRIPYEFIKNKSISIHPYALALLGEVELKNSNIRASLKIIEALKDQMEIDNMQEIDGRYVRNILPESREIIPEATTVMAAMLLLNPNVFDNPDSKKRGRPRSLSDTENNIRKECWISANKNPQKAADLYKKKTGNHMKRQTMASWAKKNMKENDEPYAC